MKSTIKSKHKEIVIPELEELIGTYKSTACRDNLYSDEFRQILNKYYKKIDTAELIKYMDAHPKITPESWKKFKTYDQKRNCLGGVKIRMKNKGEWRDDD